MIDKSDIKAHIINVLSRKTAAEVVECYVPQYSR